MAQGYTLLDHTADLRIRVAGVDRADLFKNAGLALFDLISPLGAMESAEAIELDVTGDDPADLMVNFLRELLYLWAGREKLVTDITLGHISDTALSARVFSVDFQPQRHAILHEIKAVTYHRIDVGPALDGWRAEVVFDV